MSGAGNQTTLYVVRHGQTAWNVAGRFQGRGDSPLTPRGVAQAEATARLLLQALDDPAAAAICASPLPRTRRTAASIAGVLGIASERQSHSPLLAECDIGQYEGLTREEIDARSPGERDEREADKWAYRFPGGESYADVHARTSRWLAEWEQPGEVVVVTHGIASRTLRGAYLGLDGPGVVALDRHEQDRIYVGAEAVNMSEGLFINSWYPPESHLKGILVDGNGQRFVNEDAYVGRTSDAIMRKADGNAFLIVDDEIYGQTQALHKLAAVEETIEDLERALEMPEGALVHTVARYNELAARGEDPYFHKAPKWLRPLTASPFAAVDCRVGRCILGGMTLGGLAARATGEALDGDGEPIPGLFVAGRNAVGLCREGRTYASGLSIGDATYFGRLAGRQMAAAEPWEETG